MIEWVEELRAGFTAEFATGPQVVTLATVEGAGTRARPRVRNVVCRRLTDHGTLWVASDARSGKNAQLRENVAAEVCAWLPSLRRQFRLTCTGRVVGEQAGLDADAPPELRNVQNLRELVWSEMSEAARALFFWPNPREPRVADPAAFPPAVRTGLPPTNFEVVALFPTLVDLLELGSHPHRRRLWHSRNGRWPVEHVNP